MTAGDSNSSLPVPLPIAQHALVDETPGILRGFKSWVSASLLQYSLKLCLKLLTGFWGARQSAPNFLMWPRFGGLKLSVRTQSFLSWGWPP